MENKHKHLIISSKIEIRPDIHRYKHDVRNDIHELVRMIDMKILGGPYYHYISDGPNQGITVTTIIETSHIIMHTWDKDYPIQMELDIYSCKDIDLDKVFEWMDRFTPVDIKYKYLDRTKDLIPWK